MARVNDYAFRQAAYEMGTAAKIGEAQKEHYPFLL